MSLTTLLPSSLCSSLLLGSAGLLAFYILSFYYKVSRFPKGPTPLPFVGNMLLFRRSKKCIHELFNELSDQYDPVYTIYMGPKPIVVIADSKLGIECMRKVGFAGRPDYGITRAMFPYKSIDVFFGDYSREWEVLKKVSHEAIQKYTRSLRHPHVVVKVVDQMVDRMESGFEALEDFTLMLNAILASAAFGKEYRLDDKEFLNWKKSVQGQQSGRGKILLITFVPIFRYIFRDVWNLFIETKEFQRSFVKSRYDEALASFDGSNIRTFCEAVIAAERDATSEDKEIARYMTTNNLHNVIFDLFFAGTDTTKNTLAWIFLLACKHADLQERMRKEIISVIGPLENIPSPEHKEECHYTMAFIHECMRYRSITPNGVPHKTTADIEDVGGHRIPKGTIVLHPYYRPLYDDGAWKDPNSFDPDRFLVDGRFSKQGSPFFLAFGVGRRSCPGNQLALLTMFLVISRMMQHATARNGRFVIRNNDTVDLEGQKIAAAWIASKYTMTIE